MPSSPPQPVTTTIPETADRVLQTQDAEDTEAEDEGGLEVKKNGRLEKKRGQKRGGGKGGRQKNKRRNNKQNRKSKKGKGNNKKGKKNGKSQKGKGKKNRKNHKGKGKKNGNEIIAELEELFVQYVSEVSDHQY